MCCQPTLGGSLAAIRNVLLGVLLAVPVAVVHALVFGDSKGPIAITVAVFSFAIVYAKPPILSQKVWFHAFAVCGLLS